MNDQFIERAYLHRYFNGRPASIDIDKILPTFEPFHGGIVDQAGTVPLSFPGFKNDYEMRLGADAVERRVTLQLTVRLPILAPGFWFCIHCLMRQAGVVLIAPIPTGFFYAHKSTPAHVPTGETNFTSLLMYVEKADELVNLFAHPIR